MDEERKRFEAKFCADMLVGGDDLVWDEKRNCYSVWQTHWAWQSWLAAKADAKAQAEAARPVVEPFKITASAAMAMTDDDLAQALIIHFGRQIEDIQRAMTPCNADAMAVVLCAASRASMKAVAEIRRLAHAPYDEVSVPSLLTISAG